MGTPASPPQKNTAFTFACGLFACLAFAQLLAVGIVIASRVGETREVTRLVKGDPIIVTVPTLPDEAPQHAPVKPRSVDQMLADLTDPSDIKPKLQQETPAVRTAEVSPIPESAPTISSPEVERLVRDAHQAHSDGDLVKALLKLEEAEALSPEEPAIFYRKALLFEDMGQFESATSNYEKLFVMGPEIGVYYHKAAFKLSNGINSEQQKEQLLVFGPILRRISDDRLQARLTIPIRAIAGAEFDPAQIVITVHHYDLVDNKKIEAVPASRSENIEDRWLTEPIDWANDEEIAESTYTLPKFSETDVHLFGERKYFGFVAELYYKNELIDQQAYPRRLHAIHAKSQSQPGYDMPWDSPIDEALPDINPDNPLLPALPRY